MKPRREWLIFSPMMPASNFKSASLPSAIARSDHTRGRRIRPSPIFCSRLVEREKKIQVRFSTPVLALEQDDAGAVVGVKTKDGMLTARKIILASGGFGASAGYNRRVTEGVGNRRGRTEGVKSAVGRVEQKGSSPLLVEQKRSSPLLADNTTTEAKSGLDPFADVVARDVYDE